MAQERHALLLGDIGGTNARFALLETDGPPAPPDAVVVEEHAGIAEAINAYLVRRSVVPRRIVAAVLAVAGPVAENCCVLTNSGWVVDGALLAQRFDLATVRVVNDFEANAWALPVLHDADVRPIGGGQAVPGEPIAVIGPGTGLGMACHVPPPRGPVVIAAEGGHATIAGADAREDAILAWLRDRFGHVSAERVLSGPGLRNLHDALAAIDGVAVPPREPPEITQRGLDGTCPVCRAALDLFCALLGSVAGNLALTLGARGGVYLAGGIPPRILPHLERSAFRARFEAKGRLRRWLAAIPTRVVVRPDMALLGLAVLARAEGLAPA
jgi:glucokinase